MANASRILAAIVMLLFILFVCPASAWPGQEKNPPTVEQRVVRSLVAHVKPGEPVIVSDLYNNVFKTPEERKVLDRLFNTFFKIPLFVAQYKASTGEIPTLADISRQFNLPVEGEASLLLSIIDSDPRVPKFIRRHPGTGEIVDVDIDAVKKDSRFGRLLERTLIGWVGKTAPPFTLELLDGSTLQSAELRDKSYLIYFWFSGCPPCMSLAPHLVELQKMYAGRNFTIVAVNSDRLLQLETTDADRAAYIKKVGFTFPVGHLNEQMQEAYGNINVYPTLFLVGTKGIIHQHYVNYQKLDVLAQAVKAMIEGNEGL